MNSIIAVLVISFFLLLAVGCASTNHSFAGRTVVLGLDISWSPETKIPNVRLGYVTHEGMAIAPSHRAEIKKNYDDVALFTASGSISTSMTIDSNRID